MAELIDNIFSDLENTFKSSINDFFFTEKELHSYFLNLCFIKKQLIHNNYLLVHSEYPTPFKCSYNDSEIIRIENDKSKFIRAHIDMVFINPNYVDWIVANNYGSRYISGIAPYGLFSETKADLIKKYEEFYKEKKESILDYAIEFKYLRHGFLGEKYPIRGVIQDIEKLKLLKTFTETEHNGKFKFVENTLSAVFIEERCKKIIPSLENMINNTKYEKESVKLIKK